MSKDAVSPSAQEAHPEQNAPFEQTAPGPAAPSTSESRRNERVRSDSATQGKRKRVRRDVLMLVLGAVVAWTCTRLLNTAFPEGIKEVTVSERPTGLLWAIKARPLSDLERNRLHLLRRDPPDAAVLALYFKNTGAEPLSRVSFLIELDSAIIAHVLPSGLVAVDSLGEIVTDQLRRFSYERSASFAYLDVPPQVGVVVPFIVKNRCKYTVYCKIHDRFVAPGAWPDDVEFDENVLANLVYDGAEEPHP